MEEGSWKAGASARVSENNRRDPGGGSTPASVWRLEQTWRVSGGQEGRSQLGENDGGGEAGLLVGPPGPPCLRPTPSQRGPHSQSAFSTAADTSRGPAAL